MLVATFSHSNESFLLLIFNHLTLIQMSKLYLKKSWCENIFRTSSFSNIGHLSIFCVFDVERKKVQENSPLLNASGVAKTNLSNLDDQIRWEGGEGQFCLICINSKCALLQNLENEGGYRSILLDSYHHAGRGPGQFCQNCIIIKMEMLINYHNDDGKVVHCCIPVSLLIGGWDDQYKEPMNNTEII